MTNERIVQDSNPLVSVTISSEANKKHLCRTLGRIWENPDFLIAPSVRETVSHFVDSSLLGKALNPDLILIDMEAGEKNACAIIDTIRSFAGLRRTPLIATLEGDNAQLMYQTYDAGADLVIFWNKLELRTGDIAALVIDNWLNTEENDPNLMSPHSRYQEGRS